MQDEGKVNETRINQINEKAYRLRLEKNFKRLDEDRKKNLLLMNQKFKYTKSIILTISHTVFQSIVAIFAGFIYVANTYYKEHD